MRYPPLRYYLERVLRNMGGISHWAAKVGKKRTLKYASWGPTISGSEKGVFWKRGLFRKVHFLEILENLEILEFLENPQTLENKVESDHFLEILENLEILEILEIPPVKRPLS